jgi:hypothetical protein
LTRTIGSYTGVYTDATFYYTSVPN